MWIPETDSKYSDTMLATTSLVAAFAATLYYTFEHAAFIDWLTVKNVALPPVSTLHGPKKSWVAFWGRFARFAPCRTWTSVAWCSSPLNTHSTGKRAIVESRKTELSSRHHMLGCTNLTVEIKGESWKSRKGAASYVLFTSFTNIRKLWQSLGICSVYLAMAWYAESDAYLRSTNVFNVCQEFALNTQHVLGQELPFLAGCKSPTLSPQNPPWEVEPLCYMWSNCYPPKMFNFSISFKVCDNYPSHNGLENSIRKGLYIIEHTYHKKKELHSSSCNESSSLKCTSEWSIGL